MFHGWIIAALLISMSAVLHPTQDSLVDLWGNTDAIRDDAGRMSLADVRAAHAPWRRQTALPVLHTATRLRPAITWYRIRVHPTDAGRYFIVVSQHVLDAELSVPLDKGKVVRRHTGGDVPAFRKHGDFESFTAQGNSDASEFQPTANQNVIALPPRPWTGDRSISASYRRTITMRSSSLPVSGAYSSSS